MQGSNLYIFRRKGCGLGFENSRKTYFSLYVQMFVNLTTAHKQFKRLLFILLAWEFYSGVALVSLFPAGIEPHLNLL